MRFTKMYIFGAQIGWSCDGIFLSHQKPRLCVGLIIHRSIQSWFCCEQKWNWKYRQKCDKQGINEDRLKAGSEEKQK